MGMKVLVSRLSLPIHIVFYRLNFHSAPAIHVAAILWSRCLRASFTVEFELLRNRTCSRKICQTTLAECPHDTETRYFAGYTNMRRAVG
jgi:hypothetical protein